MKTIALIFFKEGGSACWNPVMRKRIGTGSSGLLYHLRDFHCSWVLLLCCPRDQPSCWCLLIIRMRWVTVWPMGGGAPDGQDSGSTCMAHRGAQGYCDHSPPHLFPPPPAPRPSMTTFYCTMTAWLVPKPQPFVLWFVEPLNYMDYFSPCLATVPSLHSIQYKLFKNLN